MAYWGLIFLCIFVIGVVGSIITAILESTLGKNTFVLILDLGIWVGLSILGYMYYQQEAAKRDRLQALYYEDLARQQNNGYNYDNNYNNYNNYNNGY